MTPTADPTRAVVVDDEPLARDELRFLLSQCTGVEVVGEAQDAPQALELCVRVKPDLAFVDLRMPGPDGISLAESLHSLNPSLRVVVVSAHDEGALRAFDARVSDYLLKPVRLSRLQQAITRVRGSEVDPRSSPEGAPLVRLAVRRRGAWVVVSVDDVVWFEVKDELVWAVTDRDRYALDLPLAKLERQVPPGSFFRCHRGVLVRVDRIRSIEPTGGSGTFALALEHPDEPRVPLARERARSLRELIPVAG